MAQTIADPMRPYGYSDPAASTTRPGPVTSRELHLVKSSKSGQMALIGGQQVRVGQKVGDSKVISVSDSVVVLKDENGKLTTLRMFSDVEKKPLGQTQRPGHPIR